MELQSTLSSMSHALSEKSRHLTIIMKKVGRREQKLYHLKQWILYFHLVSLQLQPSSSASVHWTAYLPRRQYSLHCQDTSLAQDYHIVDMFLSLESILVNVVRQMKVFKFFWDCASHFCRCFQYFPVRLILPNIWGIKHTHYIIYYYYNNTIWSMEPITTSHLVSW